MSKDEMKPARIDRRLTAAHERIEELERAVEFQKKAWTADLAENDALQADNARLREALEDGLNKISQMCFEGEWTGIETTIDKIRKTLTAAPEQSLARIKNQVRDECAGVCDRFAEREMHPAECAAAIRVMKEPE